MCSIENGESTTLLEKCNEKEELTEWQIHFTVKGKAHYYFCVEAISDTIIHRAAFETIDFYNDTAEMSFARLNNWLESYIEDNLQTQADKSQRVVFVLSVGTERILKRDREALDRIIAGLEEKYDDVY